MYTLNFILSIFFIFIKHPMSMGMTLLAQTILVSFITGISSNNFWFSYILFLIMIGGMLVLFTYMTSIASNELFNFSSKMMIFMMLVTFSAWIIINYMDMYIANMDFLFNESFESKNYNNSLNKFFNYPSIFILIFIILYLFITLIAIVKITKIEYGPLRQMF